MYRTGLCFVEVLVVNSLNWLVSSHISTFQQQFLVKAIAPFYVQCDNRMKLTSWSSRAAYSPRSMESHGTSADISWYSYISVFTSPPSISNLSCVSSISRSSLSPRLSRSARWTLWTWLQRHTNHYNTYFYFANQKQHNNTHKQKQTEENKLKPNN